MRILYRLIEHEPVVYWRSVYEDLHHGIMPLGLFIADSKFRVHADPTALLRIPSDAESEDARVVAQFSHDLQQFLVANRLVADQHTSKEPLFTDDSTTLLSNVRRKAARDMLITRYALEMKKKKRMSSRAYIEFYNRLELQTQLRLVDTSTIPVVSDSEGLWRLEVLDEFY